MKLEWVLTDTHLRCDKPKSPDTDTICELPWDHIVLQNGEPARMTNHMGRSGTDAWYSWD
jgi:hypothetical protein